MEGKTKTGWYLVGGFKYFLCSSLLGEVSHFGLIFFRWVETTNQKTLMIMIGLNPNLDRNKISTRDLVMMLLF